MASFLEETFRLMNVDWEAVREAEAGNRDR